MTTSEKRCKHCKQVIWNDKGRVKEYTTNIVNEFSATEYREYTCEDCRVEARYVDKIFDITPSKYRKIKTDRKLELDKSLFITGEVGTGKTVYLFSLIEHYIRQNKSVKYINFSEFLMKLKHSYSSKEDNPYDIEMDISTFDGWLFIDDLGAERMTDWVGEIVYNIINYREQRELPLIITSNYSLNEIDKHIDRRISSRIAGICEVLRFRGKDRRINDKS